MGRTPVPGIAKLMVSVPVVALAVVIASRTVHSVALRPLVLGSLVELTVNSPDSPRPERSPSSQPAREPLAAFAHRWGRLA